MILYYSGSATGKPKVEPEYLLGDCATIMLSYLLIKKKWQDQDKRFPKICEARSAHVLQQQLGVERLHGEQSS